MKRVTARQKQEVARRAHGRCEYCRSLEAYSSGVFSVDHIEPKSLGGETTLDNLSLACQTCNNLKYNKTEAQDPITERLFRKMVIAYNSRYGNTNREKAQAIPD